MCFFHGISADDERKRTLWMLFLEFLQSAHGSADSSDATFYVKNAHRQP